MENKITPTEFAVIRDTMVLLNKKGEYSSCECIDFFKASNNNYIICRKGNINDKKIFITYNLKFNKSVVELKTEYFYHGKTLIRNSAILLSEHNNERELFIIDNNYLTNIYRFKENAEKSELGILPMLEELKIKKKVKINVGKFGKKKSNE